MSLQEVFHLDLPANDFEFNESIDSDSGASSFVGNVSYDNDDGTMTVTLNGKTYSYGNVSRRVFDSWMGAGSRGAFYNRSVKGQLTESSQIIPKDPSCSPSHKQARNEFEMLTGIKLPVLSDAKQLLELYKDNRLVIPEDVKQKIEQKKIKNPPQEFTWDGQQTMDSWLSNGLTQYPPKLRNQKFVKEIREGKMGMIDKNVRIIRENGHVIIPYKGSSWEKFHDYRAKAKQNKLGVTEAMSLLKMELQLAHPKVKNQLVSEYKNRIKK